MTEVTLKLPVDVAEEIERRATALGTTPSAWMSAMVQDVVADLPDDESEDGPDGFICR